MCVETEEVDKSTNGPFNIGACYDHGSESEEETNIVSLNNLVDAFLLKPIDKKNIFPTVMDFESWLQEHMRVLLRALREHQTPEEDKKIFREQATGIYKFLVRNFEELDFYTGVSGNPHTLICALYDTSTRTERFYYIAAAIQQQLCC